MSDIPKFFRAKVVRWVDGDSVWLDVDLGFRARLVTDFRLYGVDTPERGQPGWGEATAFVNAGAPAGSPVEIQSYKDPDKYGRWLAEVFVPDAHLSLNAQLLDAGLAVEYFGRNK